MNMSENRTSVVEASQNSGKWIVQLLAGVILAEGIWGFLVSLINHLLVPLLAREMEADPQSPLYLGKGEFDVAALFKSGLALCLAGILFVILQEWSRKGQRAKTARVISKVTQSSGGGLSIAVSPDATSAPRQAISNSVSPSQISQAPTSFAAETPAMSQPESIGHPTSSSSVSVTAPKPTKPKPAKREVYYNIVGEPVNPTEKD
jgi:hypothetical protein